MSDYKEFNEKKENVDNNKSTENEGTEIVSTLTIPEDLQQGIKARAEEIKKSKKLRKVFAIVVAGEEGTDDKPYYIGYFKRPGLMAFSQYMTFVQKDVVQANKNLAQNVFLEGDRELIDDEELFIFGLMQQIGSIISSLDTTLVKA